MDIAEVYAALQASDLANKADLIAGIKKQVALVLDEKRQAVEKLNATETTIAAIVEGTRATGESVADKLKDAAAKIKILNDAAAERDKTIATLTSEKTALEAEKTQLANKSTIQSVATKLGASETVLATLVPDASKITVEGDAVKIDGKAWDEWLKSDTVAPFVPALLPKGVGTTTTTSAAKPPLPTGKAGGGDEGGKSLYDAIRPKPWTPGNPAA